MKEFNLGTDAIAGRNVLEASAGTGKTFTIAGLYLRLVLEQHMDVESILVVTFTDAATAELTQRIRDTLKSALRAFTNRIADGSADGDEYKAPIPSLLENVDAKGAIERLTRNLHTFDEASIYTIHGFCRTLLLEHSFESGSQFGCELETDQQSLIEGAVADYWRETLGGAPPLLAAALADPSSGLGITALTHIVKQAMDHLDVEIIPEAPASRTAVTAGRYAKAFAEARTVWTAERAAIANLLAGNTQLSQTWYKAEKVKPRVQAADLYFSQPGVTGLFPDGLGIFTQSKINESVKKNCTAPSHPFFTAAEELRAASLAAADAIAEEILAVKRRAFPYVLTHLAERKHELNILSFNDLLLTTRDAVCSASAQPLIDKLRNRYSAVLIDEFQDTDPVQYTIFSRLFADGNTVLFYIGDPKQAIYGFRGADVFAYMTATAERGVRKATLGTNHRSTEGLIRAVNTLFTHAHAPFIFEEIAFSPVSAPPQRSQRRLLIDGREPEPMTIMFSPYTKPEGNRRGGIALNKERSTAAAIALTVDEIVRLLALGREGKAEFKDGDAAAMLDEDSIAVLVRTNPQARKMQEALLAAGVQSVIRSNKNIFASREAGELLRVMNAAAEPESAQLLRSALITPLFGLDAGALDALNADGVRLGLRHEQFKTLNTHWKRYGFIDMFSRLMEQEDMLSRLLKMSEGERRASNLLQLLELLQHAESGEKLSPLALVKRLSQQIASGDAESEEFVENLSTDRKAVKIATVHSSKGLQYKIVFCPFLWDVGMLSPHAPKPAVFYHDAIHGHGPQQLMYDIGSTSLEEHTRAWERETLAELNRLAYVALTRAEYRCVVVYGNFSSAERSPIGYLLHGTADATDLAAILADENRVFADLTTLAAEAHGSILVRRAGEPEGLRLDPGKAAFAPAEELSPRQRARLLDAAGTVASFTSLAQHADRDRRLLYVDEAAAPDASVKPEERTAAHTIFTFAKGKMAGDFFHDVFEKIDFSMSDAEAVISSRMKKYGIDASEAPAALEAVRNVLRKKLPDVAPDFSLSMLANSDRRHETNFYFPLTPFVRKQLRRFMNEYTSADDNAIRDDIGDLRVKGWLNGKIDLLFTHNGKYYLLDWKSNYLGSVREAYEPGRLREAMVRDDYFLQSLLYIIGTDRYLRDRLSDYTYDTHFGGVFYIFLRGVDAAADDQYGIFFEKPERAQIRRLEALIAAPMPSERG